MNMHNVHNVLVQEVNKDGIKVRITRKSYQDNIGLYDVCSYVGGVEQHDLWCDFRSLTNALNYADSVFLKCCRELEIAA